MDMGVQTGTGIAFTLDVDLKVDWRNFTTNMGVVAAQGFALAFGIDGFSNGISALIGALSSVKTDLSPRRCGWELFCLSFAWSFDSLREDLADGEDAKRAALEALASAKDKIGKDTSIIPVSFLEHPTTLPLYQACREVFVERRTAFRPTGAETAESLRARFDSAFNRAIFEVWSKRPERFTPLAQALNSPGATANAFEREWDAYRQRLIYDFNVRPVFGQEQTKVSLAQLYVPLRGTWSDIPPGQANASARGPADPQATQHVVQLDHMLDQWAMSTDPDDWLRLIGGGPGSGKSTTVKALAARLATKPHLRVLYVPLQHIDLSRELREAVNSYFTAVTDSAFRQPPLERSAVENGPRLVIIFDGLDELSRPGDGSTDVVSRFTRQLVWFRSALAGEQQHALRIVVTGRTVGFQEAQQDLCANGAKSYVVAGFRPLSDKAQGDTALIKRDQRPEWWSRYATIAGLARAVPPAMTDEELAGLTDEPLLCYLLALSGYATTDYEEAADNHNRIYAKLIEEVWRRGWGDGPGHVRRQGPGRTLSLEDFRRLMETIALAAWHGGDTRVASEDRFRSALKICGTEACWDLFQKENGPDVGNLAMNFYLKSNEADRRGYEFTHKSFGDYLTARAIFRIAHDLGPQIDRRIDPAAGEWLAATGSGILTQEILFFLRDEARGEATDCDINHTSLKASFERLATHALTEGFPAHQQGAKCWREAERQQNNAEAMAWAVLNSYAWGLHKRGAKPVVRVFWPNADALRQMINRLSTECGPIVRCLAFIHAEGCNLSSLNLMFADFSHAAISNGRLFRSNCFSAIFDGATLDNAVMLETNLSGCSFEKTSLVDAKIIDARITASGWIDVDISRARLSKSVLTALNIPLSHISAATSALMVEAVVHNGSISSHDGRFTFTPKNE
jgi:NACHT domain/Pentapeptide repeats (8 copies)